MHAALSIQSIPVLWKLEQRDQLILAQQGLWLPKHIKAVESAPQQARAGRLCLGGPAAASCTLGIALPFV